MGYGLGRSPFSLLGSNLGSIWAVFALIVRSHYSPTFARLPSQLGSLESNIRVFLFQIILFFSINFFQYFWIVLL